MLSTCRLLHLVAPTAAFNTWTAAAGTRKNREAGERTAHQSVIAWRYMVEVGKRVLITLTLLLEALQPTHPRRVIYNVTLEFRPKQTGRGF